MGSPAFSKMPLAVFSDPRLSIRDLRVLGLLFAHADKQGRCWPSRKQLADLSGLPVSKISVATSRLESFGWLTKTGNGGRSRACEYVLHMADGVPEGRGKGSETVTETVTVTKPVTVTGLGTKTVTGSGTKTVTPVGNTHRTDHEQTREQTSKPIRAFAAQSAGEGAQAELGFPSSPAPPSPHPEPGGKQPPLEEGFARFWQAYPRKRSKGDAWKAWRALAPCPGLVQRLIAALGQARQSEDWRREGGRFIPYPATWLRARGWEDEFEVGVEPLAEQGGESRKFQGTVTALRALFGEQDAAGNVSAVDDIPGDGFWERAVPGTGGRVLGPVRRPAG